MLGPAVTVERVIKAVQEVNPELVALSYRLSPQAGKEVLADFWQQAQAARITEGRRFAFGGTPPVAREACKLGFFEAIFDGSETPRQVYDYLAARTSGAAALSYPSTLAERIEAARPWPIFRHHFGQPSYEATLAGVAELAESGVLDVISLGIDQNTQEHFFHPEAKDPRQRGAGGVPVDTPEQFQALYEASRRGNYPLMRCYSGTRDLIRMQAMLLETINLAWAAIPLTWYSVLDGRSQRGLRQTIVEAQEVMRWLSERKVPVEMNESHHWSLRDAHDVVAVVMAFLAAYNAKQAGVRDYVAQYMFNTPPLTSFRMDLAKMLAKVALIESLEEEGRFRVFRETRTGLRSLPLDMDEGKGHLGASVFLQMALHPDIVHVVAYCEADHAATVPEIVESVKMARGAIADALGGMPDLAADPVVMARRDHLLKEARVLLSGIAALADTGTADEPDSNDSKDPFTDPDVLTRAISLGLIDAPHLAGNPAPEACGRVVTNVVDGAYEAIDPATGRVLSEEERITRILRERDPASYRRFRRGEAEAWVERLWPAALVP